MKTAIDVFSARQTDFYFQARVRPREAVSRYSFITLIYSFIPVPGRFKCWRYRGEQDRQGPWLQAASILLRNNIEIIAESVVAVIWPAGVAWGVRRSQRKHTRAARIWSQTGLWELWRKNLPGRRTRKDKAPEDETGLAVGGIRSERRMRGKCSWKLGK